MLEMQITQQGRKGETEEQKQKEQREKNRKPKPKYINDYLKCKS